MPDYDLVVVGGGINGVGVAQAAAANGYTVLLLEKNGLGSGTSSKSSKLIHGGLRYLESWEFHLVRKPSSWSQEPRGTVANLASRSKPLNR